MTERFVGQHAAEERAEAKFRADRWGAAPVDTYDDPDHLYQAHADLVASTEGEKEKRAVLRAYIKFWAGVKRQEIRAHEIRACWHQCSSCLLCLCQKSILGRFWCRCSSGLKMLSPYRLVWLNGSVKKHALTNIWQIGVGYVPRDTKKYEQHALGLDT